MWLAPTLTSTVRSPPQTRCQMVAPQGARLRVTKSAMSQGVVKLLEVINDVTEKLQGEDKVEKADQVDLVQDTVEEQLQLLAQRYQ